MSSKRRYYLLRITNQIGSYSVDAVVRFQTTGDPHRFAGILSKYYWGEPDKMKDGDNENSYSFAQGQVLTFACTPKEITRAAFVEIGMAGVVELQARRYH